MDSIWKQEYTSIIISRRIFGIWIELYQENYYIGATQDEFFQLTKQKYLKKFKGKPFKMRLYYPDYFITIQNKK